MLRTAGAVGLFVRRAAWMLPFTLALLPLLVPLANGFTRSLSMPSWWSIARVWKGYGAPFVLTNLPYLYFGHRLWREREHPPLLPFLLFASGVVSVLYHTLQVAGPRVAREAACFVDHGFAISTAFYFAKTCWPPGPRSLALFAGGLALLPGWGDQLYTMTHSFWHAFSATAAYVACRERVARLRRLVGGTASNAADESATERLQLVLQREDAPRMLQRAARRGFL